MGFLFKRTYIENSTTETFISLDTGIRDIPTDSEWMTIYHNGQKLGYSVYSIQNRGKNGYSVSSTTRMRTAIAGIETQLRLQNRVTVDTLFRLKSFDFLLLSDKIMTRIEGVKKDKFLQITYIQGHDSTTQMIQIPEELYTYIGIQPMVTWQGIKEGQRIKVPSFDPVTMEVADMEITHEGKEELIIGGVTQKLNKIRVLFRGIPSILWLDDNGLTFREESIMGLMMERTSPTEALQTDAVSNIDLMDIYAIPIENRIVDPSSVSELIVEIYGVDPYYLTNLNTDRQKVLDENPLQVRLRPVAESQSNDSPGQYLKSSPIIQSTHPRILNLTQKIMREALSTEDKAQRLSNWVYGYLHKRPVVSLSSAVEILDGKQGDCSEHTILFTALSRGAGIPTKIHIGIVYLEGRFLYHTWPVVFIDNKWVSVDPTLGQTIADATHIAFLEGDFTNLHQLIPILGRISIRIIDQKYEKGKIVSGSSTSLSGGYD